MLKYRVTFQPAGVTVEVDPTLFPLGRHGRAGSLLDVALANGISIPHSCEGAGVCGTCHVHVVSGMDNLSQADNRELDLIDSLPGSRLDSRLACQAVVGGDVEVTLPRTGSKV